MLSPEMNIIQPDITEQGRIRPFVKNGIEVMSTEFFSEHGKPILWRGALIKSMLSNFFFQVDWSPELEYVLLDMPAGTGDAMNDISEIIPSALVLLVTTPHPVATEIVIKTGMGYRELHHELIGIVENMAYFVDPNTKEHHYLCGKDGGLYAADALQLEVLASIPIAKPNKNFIVFDEDEAIGEIYHDLATLITIHN